MITKPRDDFERKAHADLLHFLAIYAGYEEPRRKHYSDFMTEQYEHSVNVHRKRQRMARERRNPTTNRFDEGL